MKILGAIIAGGKARRFGSDKALALHGGRRLIDIVASGLESQVTDRVICGRAYSNWVRLEDRPAPGLGPLGGLCAALHHAHQNDYQAVLSVATDVLPLPPQLATWLSGPGGPAFVRGQHLLGFWPVALAAVLEDHLAISQDRSLRGWIARSGAKGVELAVDFANINTLDDLDSLNNPIS
jgi:molybdopterin-guanine dinucleotide biosynthesis protein A